jgi:hypothetical protein
MRPCDVPRRSPVGLENSVAQVPGAPAESSGADSSTPSSGRGVAVEVSSIGAETAWYTTYTLDPSGAMAGAEYADRSPSFEIAVGVDHVVPSSVE